MAKPPGPSVNVPIKIWIEDDVDGRRLRDNVATTTGKQLERALTVLDGRGAWQSNLARFDVQFKGDAAKLPDDRKRELYKHVGDGVAKGTEVARARRGKDGGAKQSAAKTSTPSKGKKKTPGKLKPVAQWHEFSPDADLVAAFHAAATDWLIEKKLAAFPTTYGILFRLKGQPAVQLWVVDNGAYGCRTSVTTLAWSESKPTAVPVKGEPDRFKLSLEQETDGFEQWKSLGVQAVVDARAKAQGKGGKVKVEKIDIEQTKAAFTEEAEKVVAQYMQGWETRDLVYYWLSGLGKRILIPFLKEVYPAMPVRTRIDLVALVDMVEVPAEEAEEEEDGGGVTVPPLPDPTGSGGDKKDGGGGAADTGLGLGSDVTAPPGQDVGAGGRGVVIAPEYKTGGSIFPIVPGDPRAKSAELPCQPVHDEPPVDALEVVGRHMKELIARIAARLDMAPCRYPANFCVQAARMVRIRASAVEKRFGLDVTGDFAAALSVGEFDEKGHFHFRGLESVAVQYLQHLAATIPIIRQLFELAKRHSFPKLASPPTPWLLDMQNEATQACGLIWLAANQIMLQQLLDSSRAAVRQRQGNEEYINLFTTLCKTQLAEQVEMIMLRTALEKFIDIVGDRKGAEAYERVHTHFTVRVATEAMARGTVDARKELLLARYGLDADLVTRMSEETDYVFRRGRGAEKPRSDAGSIVESADGAWAIRASDGQLYGLDELKAMIEIRQQVLVTIDPLINQLLHRLVGAIRPLVDDPTGIRRFLDTLFNEMLRKNDEVSGRNKRDFEYAYKHAQIHKVDKETPATVEMQQAQVRGWQLSGVHALAHLHVGVRFENDPFYLASVDKLVGQEYYWRSFVEDMIFIFGTALTIICPPLGAAVSFAANLALGLNKYKKAKQQETIYGALLKPEEVLNYAEIQIEMFLAKLQIALSFLELIPYAGKGVKALTGLGKRAVSETAKRGAKQIAKELVIEELERMAKVSAEQLVKALAIELAQNEIEDKIVDLLVTPIIEGQIKDLEKDLHDEGLL